MHFWGISGGDAVHPCLKKIQVPSDFFQGLMLRRQPVHYEP